MKLDLCGAPDQEEPLGRKDRFSDSLGLLCVLALLLPESQSLRSDLSAAPG